MRGTAVEGRPSPGEKAPGAAVLAEGYGICAPAGGLGHEMPLGRETRLAAGKRVLLFGGSFDPPHTGHMALLKGALEAVRPQRVLVVPSGTAPHKLQSATPGPLRAAMCECFRPLFPGLEVCELELRRPGKSYTYDTVAELRAARPDDEYYLCLGGDMLSSFTTWHRGAELLRMVVLVVHARGREEMPGLLKAAAGLEAAGGRVVFAAGPVVEVSSSQLRQAIAAGQPVEEYLPPPVGEIIRRNGLYRQPMPEGAAP